MLKNFFRYMVPSMLAFVFSGLYCIVDGFFVGQNVGDAGLAAINIAFPLAALIQSLGTGIGMGGAVQLSICRGKGDPALEHKFLGNTLVLLAAVGIVLMGILFAISRPALILFGAEGLVLEYGLRYIRIFICGTLFQMMATGFIPILRNYEAATLAMGAMIAGLVANIILDALFVSVFDFGVDGAAWATTISQVITTIPCIVFLAKKLKQMDRSVFRPRKSVLTQILKVGISPFGLAMSPNLVLMIMNKSAAVYGGDVAVAAYAVIAYVNSIILLMFQGIGDGSQPLISFHFGKGEWREVRIIRKWAYLFAVIVAAIYLALIYLLRGSIPAFFGASDQAAEIVIQVLPLFAIGAAFVAVCRVTTSYFYAVRDNIPAYILVYGEPIILTVLLVFVFPHFWNIWGVWISVPVSQFLLMLASLLLLRREKRTAGRKEMPVPQETTRETSRS